MGLTEPREKIINNPGSLFEKQSARVVSRCVGTRRHTPRGASTVFTTLLLSVGYPVINAPWFSRVVEEHRDRIGEIYFSWKNTPSGRMTMPPCWQKRMERDLSAFKELGLELCLLINGNCYGAKSVSDKFARSIIKDINNIKALAGSLHAVTTTSPFVAHVVKREFPDIEVRASINMRIGTVEGMTYLKDNFDSFYVQREYNHNFEHLQQLRQWADINGKKLHGLLNSGCLNFCSNQIFHDNLVAHEKMLSREKCRSGFNPVICHRFYANPENVKNFALYSNWIRPEDLHLYEKLFDGVKLATRMHIGLAKVITAYARREWKGNIAELLEPQFEHLVDKL